MYKLFIFEVTRVQALEAGVPACGERRPGTVYSVVDYDSFSGGHIPQDRDPGPGSFWVKKRF
jgi:hypothetical protein